MLVDSHCHLDFNAFDPDRHQQIEAAKERLVKKILIPGVKASDFSRILNLQAQYPKMLVVALGLHPVFTHQHKREDLQTLESMVANNDVIALGEMGLDGRADQAPIKNQLSYLEPQLALAKAINKPVILHVVKTHEQMLSILKATQLPAAGVIHAFSGSIEQAKQYIRLGFKLGFGGAITYERAHKQHRLITELPLESILLETDAPDLPLQGFEGQANFPAQVHLIHLKIAQLRKINPDEVAKVTSQNFVELFT